MSLRTLGAVLAGGQSSRFGADKALALLGGRPLIGWVTDALVAQCDAVVICGRPFEDFRCLPDWPASKMGPLGGLAAALLHGAEAGFDQVLSAPCDTPHLPATLLALLGEAPAFLVQTPVIGLWPTALAEKLDAFIHIDSHRSMRGWAGIADARAVSLPIPIANVNTPDDLNRL